MLVQLHLALLLFSDLKVDLALKFSSASANFGYDEDHKGQEKDRTDKAHRKSKVVSAWIAAVVVGLLVVAALSF